MSNVSTTTTCERASNIVRKCRRLKWIITNFSLYDTFGNHEVNSCVFPGVDASWKFSICYSSYSFCFDIYLTQTDSKCKLKNVNYKISLVDKNGVHCCVRENCHDCSKYLNSSIMINVKELNDKREELLPNDILTIFCELTYVITEHSLVRRTEQQGDATNSTEAQDCASVMENHSKLEIEHKQQVGDIKNGGEKQETAIDSAKKFSSNVKGFEVLSQNFEDLLHREHLCDVTINVQDKTFRAHTLILSARSSILATMLQHDMKEKHTGIVNIADCDPVAFEDFLLYLYSGKMEIVSSKNVLGLYKAADKYDVKDLKEECVRFMMGNMSVEMICDAIALAVIHDETELIKNATEYFTANTQEILLTGRWQTFMQENPVIANELYIKAFCKNFDKE